MLEFGGGGDGRRGVGAVGFRSVVQWMPAHADRAGQVEGSGGPGYCRPSHEQTVFDTAAEFRGWSGDQAHWETLEENWTGDDAARRLEDGILIFVG